ncbi:MAG: DPP IV N-terminal domain-containing protein [Gemmataceae bacterium]|nr:DPP IV N-terminal domain-containing protein [Gemmataceae bacterium]MCI0743168.1 DPP IV N-terminal domain-containing protein [Gemmataceae bacterium]
MLHHPSCRRCIVFAAALFLALCAPSAQAQQQPVSGANYPQAYKYTTEFLRQFIYSGGVTPIWVGKSDTFSYEFRTSKGKQFYLVNPRNATKEPLFDRAKLAAQLSEQVKKPLDPLQLPLTRLSLSDDVGKLKFVVDQFQYEYDLRGEKLAKLGKAPATPAGFGGDPEKLRLLKEKLGDEKFREFLERQKELKKDEDKQDKKEIQEEEIQDLEKKEEKKDEKGKGFGAGGYRVYSPDRKAFVFAMNHNLYLVEGDKKEEAVQLTKDGVEDYTFNAGGGFGGGFGGGKKNLDADKDKDKTKDRKVRPQVTWSKDSKAFYVTRSDSRGVKELFLVNNVANPRPTLTKYKYPMPGDENIRKSELFVYHKDKKKLTQIERKWKDEAYSDLHWGKTSDELRLTRRDRLYRTAEFCTINARTGECKCLILEGFENSSIAFLPMRYLDETDEMIWWSERTGWGHFYLYDRSGKLKNAITAGDFRASAIVAVDAKNRTMWFRANAREPGENAYFNHLYCVRLDGSGLTLMDPGNADHKSMLSPTRNYVVDNCSRADMATVTVLRDARGNKIMDLEQEDLSRLSEIGWRMPETFVVKAADGTTDLYGNMFKPFDFDPKKKYPVVAHVYPGPQTESMRHDFTANSAQQQLAQLGFIVIQVGNRGGSPLRSKAYQSHSYFNLRDYALADKKTAIEQLAARHPWIDIDRVGIYGHSGGGFLSAAAMLVKPYNDFFKVAVASAGNHDNNVYNNSWSERYHGMKEVTGTEDKQETKKGIGGGKFGGKGGGKFKKGGGFPPDLLDDSDIFTDFEEQEQGKGKDDKKDAKSEKDKVDKKAVKEGVKSMDEKTDLKTEDKKAATRFEIKVPTNAELAANLKGKLLLVHGDMDNNVHPANTIRLADALIKANKRFDMLIMPGKAHGFADYQPYFNQRMWEYFAEHLLGDRPTSADLFDRREKK